MKTAWALGILLFSTGCIVDQKALHPLFDASDDSAPSLAGTWRSEDDSATVVIRAIQDGFELMSIKEGKANGPLQLRLGRVGGTLYWDATPAEDEGSNDLRRAHELPVHSIARLRFSDDSLAIEPLCSDWVKTAIAEGRLDTSQVLIDDTLILTGSSAELQRLLLEHGDEEGAFGDAVVLRRVGP